MLLLAWLGILYFSLTLKLVYIFLSIVVETLSSQVPSNRGFQQGKPQDHVAYSVQMDSGNSASEPVNPAPISPVRLLLICKLSHREDLGKYFLQEPDPKQCRKVHRRKRPPSRNEIELVEDEGHEPVKSKSVVSLRSFFSERITQDKKELKKRFRSKFVLYQDEPL